MSQRYLGGIVTASPTAPTITTASGEWTLSQQLQYNSTWPKSSTEAITRSLRFRSSASAYLNRTPASAGNQQKFTWSGWVKLGSLSATTTLFAAQSGISIGTADFYLYVNSNGKIYAFQEVIQTSTTWGIATTAVYRDPAAWYHVVLSVDTTQATAANRVILYVNGVQVTSLSSTTYPSQNYSTIVNSTIAHYIGRSSQDASTWGYADGYLTEINFIDGQALTPAYFGYTDSNGIWQPSAYTGTYGTNGFRLSFSDNTSTTTLGYDTSGNGNNWTPNNISVTSGSTYDSMTDVPTLTSATAANYCVLNPIAFGSASTRTSTSNGNLSFSDATAGNTSVIGTMAPTSGKWYFEMTSSNTGVYAVGLIDQITKNESFYRNNGAFSSSFGGSGTSGYSSWTTGDVIGVAWDVDAGKIWYAKNNTWQSGSPSAGTSPTNTFTANTALTCCIDTDNTAGTKSGSFNFGQQPFTYTPPSGYVALNTYNLPASTISNGAKYMDVNLWTGTSATQTITNNGGFYPDFLWIKSRSAATDHTNFDSVRGTNKVLNTDLTAAEYTPTANTGLSSFNSNGFTLYATDVSGAGSTNFSPRTYVGWQWNAGSGTTSSNTSGSITSTVSVNATAGFSVVSWTPSAGNDTVGHGLGVAPSLIIAKPRTLSSAWPVYHSSLGANTVIYINQTAASSTGTTTWLNVTPTSTVFSTGSWFSNDGPCIAYCWAAVKGFSAFGSYTGNGSTDGPFIYTGFRPKFVMWKISSGSTGDWYILDSSRDTYNVASSTLWPDLSNAEGTGANLTDFLSNGFKFRNAGGSNNGSGFTFIYAAFAENPFSIARAR